MYEQGEADIMPFPPLRRVAEALIHQADARASATMSTST